MQNVKSASKRTAAKGAVDGGAEDDFGSIKQVFDGKSDDGMKDENDVPWSTSSNATAAADGAAGSDENLPMCNEPSDDDDDDKDRERTDGSSVEPQHIVADKTSTPRSMPLPPPLLLLLLLFENCARQGVTRCLSATGGER